jgi:SAM-dependent methyltransferase
MNPNPATETVRCPVCNGSEAERVRNRADIVQCAKCQVVYLRTRPTVAELEAHYQAYSSNPGSHMRLPATPAQVKSSGLRRDYWLNEIVEFTGANRRWLLDIGCGWGAFLDNARSKGFSVQGVEICKEMATFGTKELLIQIATQQFTELTDREWKEGFFQVVTMIHSFEHLPNQRKALELIHRILEPEGLLCGIVPNFGSYCSKTMGDAWEWLDPEMHACHFTPETLTKTLWSCGFNPLKMYTSTGDFDANKIREHLRTKAPRLSDQSANLMIENFNESNQGEEIRWFSQKI